MKRDEAWYREYCARNDRFTTVGAFAGKHDDQRLAAPVPPASTPPRVSGVGEAPNPLPRSPLPKLRLPTEGAGRGGEGYPVTQLCEQAGIAIPAYEYRFHPSRKWRFDCAWREQMIALEIEGGIWSQGRHTRGAGFLGDMEKYNAAVLLGWRVLRTTPQTLADGVKSVRLLMA